MKAVLNLSIEFDTANSTVAQRFRLQGVANLLDDIMFDRVDCKWSGVVVGENGTILSKSDEVSDGEAAD